MVEHRKYSHMRLSSFLQPLNLWNLLEKFDVHKNHALYYFNLNINDLLWKGSKNYADNLEMKSFRLIQVFHGQIIGRDEWISRIWRWIVSKKNQ